ncbi:MAG: hypothetical protein A3F04_00025 [Candidatus Chisholmbacteria bacterium RIFCSPHIGHO2_12_FULL_49_9]|uniref:Uncharacterized protein n=1 Tax=Candidatus Chisholmbacteria bacterium RIFCSPHIGHO2_01_FULL_52_32 TaxID=1797591 RepID=A0A1G1VT35_9BACT|nr:MAG: hypothetical protein A2786_03415 [Candidatus Chisholmbacteria bacterium RIFCSPHIGHO2_01_FULL_52_32]OGY20109.1 MAG: hypothetical protein A2900_03330 [Candidatus Chisholmbacteria bacterium RIFCSPLOWO2_01_FULL_50_28]OGY20679.1 MAG: hypothetical protein A3F04_00025 [Candidatus Chisholmbacteria bacterium RIFCSPHIGHO2_12_FULL_49_9]
MIVFILIVLIYWLGRQIIDRWFWQLPLLYRAPAAWGLGFLLLYPLGVLNIFLFEGQTHIYQNHIGTGLGLLIAANVALTFLRYLSPLPKRRVQSNEGHHLPFGFFLLLPAAAFLLFLNLGKADIASDEREIGYRAYDLVDGIKAGRTAYAISFNDHAPLGNYIQHFVLNALEPNGFENLSDGELRFAGAFLALLSLWVFGIIAADWFSRETAFLSSLLLATMTPFLFSGRLAIPQDLSFWNFYFLLSLLSFSWWFSTRKRQALVLSAILTGAFALIKFTGLVVLPLYFIWWLASTRIFRPSLRFFVIVLITISPVIFFNIGAYITTGFVDVPTALVLRTFGIPVRTSMAFENIYAGRGNNPLSLLPPLVLTLSDLFYPVLLFSLLFLGIVGFFRFRNLPRSFWIFFSAFCAFLFFFLFTGFRTYYLTFTAFGLVAMAASGIALFRLPIRRLVVAILAIASLGYGLSSLHFLKGPQILTGGEYGRSSEAIPPFTVSRTYSLSIRQWLNAVGWKEVKKKASTIVGNRVLVVDQRLNSERAFWYLQFNPVRAHFDPTYQPPIRMLFSSDFHCNEAFIVLALPSSSSLCNTTLYPLEIITSIYGEPGLTFFGVREDVFVLKK